MTTPTIAAVSRSPAHGFAKQPQTHIRLLAGEGVEGDAHRGTTTQHLYLKRKDPTQPNLCQVHLFAAEMLEELAAKGFHLQPGEIGENILTRNIDLLALPLGTQLQLGAEAVVEVTGLRTPCSQIDKFRAGVMAIVLRGGLVQPGDTITVSLPPKPHRPLGPV